MSDLRQAAEQDQDVSDLLTIAYMDGFARGKAAARAQPTSGDYALGYAEGFNDACKPAPQGEKQC